MLQELAEAGADISVRSRNGLMVLHLVVLSGKSAGVFEALRLGADITVQDDSGSTALMLCAGNAEKKEA